MSSAPFSWADASVTFRSAISTPAGPSGYNGQGLRTAQSSSQHHSARNPQPSNRGPRRGPAAPGVEHVNEDPLSGVAGSASGRLAKVADAGPRPPPLTPAPTAELAPRGGRLGARPTLGKGFQDLSIAGGGGGGGASGRGGSGEAAGGAGLRPFRPLLGPGGMQAGGFARLQPTHHGPMGAKVEQGGGGGGAVRPPPAAMFVAAGGLPQKSPPKLCAAAVSRRPFRAEGALGGSLRPGEALLGGRGLAQGGHHHASAPFRASHGGGSLHTQQGSGPPRRGQASLEFSPVLQGQPNHPLGPGLRGQAGGGGQAPRPQEAELSWKQQPLHGGGAQQQGWAAAGFRPLGGGHGPFQNQARSPQPEQQGQQRQQQQQQQQQGARAAALSDFGHKRSTRAVSKFHLGRQRPNLGKHSHAAELASAELQALTRAAGDGGAAAVPDLMDRWAPHLEGLEDYSFLLRELGNRGDWERALACFNWMVSRQDRNAGGARKAADWGKLASTMIATLGRLGRVEAAREVFERARAAGMGGNVYAYSALLSAYGRSGRWKEVLEMFEQMKEEGCQPNLVTYNTVIDACGKGGADVAKAREFFEEMLQLGVKPDRITYNSLMAVCGRAGRWKEAQEVFRRMEEEGVERDIFTFNTLIDAFCKAGQMQAAAVALAAMRALSVTPNVVTYSTLIDGYGKAGGVAEAVAAYREMKERGVRPDRVSYNTLLDIYGKAGRIDDALAVCREMERSGLQTDVVTFNALIDAVGKVGRQDAAEQLFEEMRGAGLRPNVLTYSALIGAYSRAGAYAKAMEAFREFRRAGLQADVVLYSALIDAHGKHGLVEEAMELLAEMMGQGIMPNVVTYNSLIDAYGRRGQVERALSTMEQMRGEGLAPNAVTYNSVIDAYGKEGRADEALLVFEQMRAEGTAPDAVTFSALIDASGKRGDAGSAVRIFREMQRAGVKPNVVTFSAVLSACSRCGTCEEASELLEEMKAVECQVYATAHGLLMGGADTWRRAEGLFDDVATLDCGTGMAFYNALTDLLWHFGQRGGSQRVLQAARRRSVYKAATWRSEAEGGCDLHLMSVGAAQTMLHVWLLDLLALATEGRTLPRNLSILTGWGKHSKVAGDSIVKRAVEARLAAMRSPFHVHRSNEGRIVARGEEAQAWLLDPPTRALLALADVRGLGCGGGGAPPGSAESRAD